MPFDKLLALAAKSQTKFGFCSLTRNFPPLATDYLFNREFYAYNGNIKEKPALCEQQSLLAANEE